MLKALLLKHEANILEPYDDATGKPLRPGDTLVGKLTIGVGRNLTDTRISYEEAFLLLDHDIRRVENDCLHAFPWYADLDEARQAVVASMVFNMGLAGFQKFKKVIAAVNKENWEDAAVEMLESHWAKQVGRRALELATIMRTGRIHA